MKCYTNQYYQQYLSNINSVINTFFFTIYGNLICDQSADHQI